MPENQKEELVEAFRKKIVRRAIEMQIGGFRPPDDPRTSWFGRVTQSAEGEDWPVHEGEAMLPLCQINLTELPYRPHRLDDVDFISVFVSRRRLPNDTPNGDGWCLRAYKDLGSLVSLRQPDMDSLIASFAMRPIIVEEDYPCCEDVADCPEELEEEYYDLFSNHSGLKLGGWPTLVQAEIFWAPWNRHPASPEYVFQIDSTEKGTWMWGDGGVGYFGRGTAPNALDDWTFSWQCY
jgi:uncharacterized protein YwqG